LKPTLLLTGATGYLGRRLLPRLLESGYRIHILKRPTSSLLDLNPTNADLHIFDVETDGLLAPFNQSEKIDTVIHLATCYGKSGESPAEILKSNFEFPASLLEAAIKHGANTFINADSYFNVLPLGGTCLDNYSLSKGLFHAWASQRADQSGRRFINLRLEHLYGPNDSSAKFVNWLVQTLLKHPPELALTAGLQERDFVFIDDVIDAFSTVISKIHAFPAGTHEVGVGSGKTTSVRDFVKMTGAMCSTKTRLIFGTLPIRKHEIMKSLADLTVLASLGWQARVSLAHGLQQVIDCERRKPDFAESDPCTS
jgi:nucleoside-diphosphate-sugar epimerase